MHMNMGLTQHFQTALNSETCTLVPMGWGAWRWRSSFQCFQLVRTHIAYMESGWPVALAAPAALVLLVTVTALSPPAFLARR